ncbi:MAG: type II toxin-antitoxin system prevent-host-death family antitoxin [Propionibacteriaceae bacterium]|nr:type II toxin-antitoxin system prevent-host-death family antitoxin [Propionibacteriaceae bacterium]
MKSVNINEAKTHLSALLAQVATGESFVIAKAGAPLALVTPYFEGRGPTERVGFLEGRVSVPDDFDTMGSDVIETWFDGGVR